MVQRHGHLASEHLRAAVERLVLAADSAEVTRKYPAAGTGVVQERHGAPEVCESGSTEG